MVIKLDELNRHPYVKEGGLSCDLSEGVHISDEITFNHLISMFGFQGVQT